MSYYVVVKRGMSDSAAIFKTRKEAVLNANRYYPDTPYQIRSITKGDALKRIDKYKKRLKGRVPQSNIDRIKLP